MRQNARSVASTTAVNEREYQYQRPHTAISASPGSHGPS